MRIELTDDTIQINIVDLFEQMSEEAKQKVIEQLAWQSPIWKELVRGVSEGYAAESYNSDIFKLRMAFFQSEDIPRALKQTINSLLNTIKHLQGRMNVYSQTLGKWYKWHGEIHPESRPISHPHYKSEWIGADEVKEFMEKNNLLELFSEGE